MLGLPLCFGIYDGSLNNLIQGWDTGGFGGLGGGSAGFRADSLEEVWGKQVVANLKEDFRDCLRSQLCLS